MLKSLGQKITVGEELGIIFEIINLTIWVSKPIVPPYLKDDFTRSLFRPFLPGPFKMWHVTLFVNKRQRYGPASEMLQLTDVSLQ